jgi:hypothetical protein
MLVFEESEGILGLRNFEREKAISFLDQGLSVISLWLHKIYQDITQKEKQWRSLS